MNVSKGDTKKAWVDPDDAPELDDAWFETANLKIGENVIRGVGRPRGSTKVQITLRLDKAVLDHFRATGKGWQTRVNDALRSSLGNGKH